MPDARRPDNASTASTGPLQRLEAVQRACAIACGHDRVLTLAFGTTFNRGINITPSLAEHLNRELSQQELINAGIRWSMRTLAPDSSYGEGYKVYRDHAAQRGLKPVSLKAFKNRALSEYGANVPYDTPNIIPLRPYVVAPRLPGMEEAAG